MGRIHRRKALLCRWLSPLHHQDTGRSSVGFRGDALAQAYATHYFFNFAPALDLRDFCKSVKLTYQR